MRCDRRLSRYFQFLVSEKESIVIGRRPYLLAWLTGEELGDPDLEINPSGLRRSSMCPTGSAPHFLVRVTAVIAQFECHGIDRGKDSLNVFSTICMCVDVLVLSLSCQRSNRVTESQSIPLEPCRRCRYPTLRKRHGDSFGDLSPSCRFMRSLNLSFGPSPSGRGFDSWRAREL